MPFHRTLLTATLLAMVLPVASQVWCPPGATWTYPFSNGWTVVGYAQFTCTGETFVHDTLAQRITIHEAGIYLPDDLPIDQEDSTFTAVNGDLVSIWTGTHFDTLYCFGAVPGDQWQTTMPDDMESSMLNVVQDTGSMVVDGVPLHYVALESGEMQVERLGSLNSYMLPWIPLSLDDPGGPLRCYADGDINYVADWWHYGCTSWTGMEEPLGTAAILLSPNPGDAQFTLTGLRAGSGIRVEDVTGRVWMQQRGVFDGATISTAGIPSGMYTVQVLSADGSQANLRWVKQ